MRVLRVVGLVTVPALVSYLFGSFFPLPWISTHPVRVQLLLQLSQVIVTTMAVTVAMFRDELRRRFLRPALDIRLDQEPLMEILADGAQSSDQDGSSPPKAERYECMLQISNEGNAPAKDCVLFVERVIELNAQDVPRDRKIPSQRLPWIGSNDGSALISETAISQVCLVTLLEPKEARGGNDSSRKIANNAPGFRIGTLEIGAAAVRVDVTIALHSEHERPVRRTLEIRWNRQWHPRLTELKSAFQIQLKGT